MIRNKRVKKWESLLVGVVLVFNLMNFLSVPVYAEAPNSAIFDFDENTSPTADNTGHTALETVTQSVNGQTISIASTGGKFVIGDETPIIGTDYSSFDKNVMAFDTLGSANSTRIRVSLQSGYTFKLNTFGILDNDKNTHIGNSIKLVSSSGKTYDVGAQINYGGNDYGEAIIDVSGTSDFDNITYFDLYANDLNMQLALDNIYLTNITAPTNQAPTDIALSASSINENVAANSTVGTLSSTDADVGNTFTYTLVSGTGSSDNASFNISGSDLCITNSPDYETKNSYSLRVRTTDQGSLTCEKAFTITINDLNEAPTDIALSASTINENVVANSTVGTLSSTDADAGNTFTYTLVSGTGSSDNAAFNINGSNLRIADSPDYETKNSYSVRIRTTDQGSLIYEKAFTITINDLNQAPTDISLSASSIDENVPIGTAVSSLSTTDPETGNTFTYTLVSGTGDTDNSSFNISGSNLCITNSPNYENKNSYSVRVQTKDQGGLTYEKPFTITVNNLNEAPSISVPASISVTEDVASALTGISFSDVDAGSNSVTATLSVGSGTLSATGGGGVTVGGSGTGSMTLTGTITNINAFIAASNVTFTTAPNATSSVTLTVGMNDGGNTGIGGAKTASSTVTLTVTPVNSAPTLSTTASTPTFTENGSPVALFSGTSIVNESGQNLTDITLTASNLKDGSNEILNIDGSDVALTNGNGTSINSMSYVVSVSGGTATVTVSKAGGISSSDMQTLVNSITYRNSSENPTAASRTVTLTSLKDNGGTANGGVDAVSLACASTVTVVTVNDAPVVGTSGGTTSFNKTTGVTATPVTIDAGITVSDADNSTLANGTVSITGNLHNTEDLLAFINDGSTMGNITASYDGASGVLSLASSGSTATIAQWQAALRAVTYTNSSDAPNTSSRTVSFRVNDGTVDSSTSSKVVSVSNVAVVPGAPTIGTMTAGDTEVTVNFTAPSSNGGAEITEYTVTASPGGITKTGATSPITVTGLTNGTAYTFTVKATNSAGTGSDSTASSSATPKAAQTITFANPGPQNFGTSLQLNATASSGLSVTYSTATPSVCDVTSSGAVTYKTIGTATILANQAGNSAYSAATTASQSFTVVAVAPDAPTGVTVTAGDTTATVSFTAPSSDGGAIVTSYKVIPTPGGVPTYGAGSPIIVSGLTNGSAYTFTVTAINSMGESTASLPSNSVTPSKNSTINLTTATFDKKTSAQADIPITMTLNGNTLTSIKNGMTTLTLGTDYTVSGSAVTILKNYLAGRSTGTVVLTFNFNLGNSQTLSISVSDSTSSSGSGGTSGGSGSSGGSGGSSSGSGGSSSGSSSSSTTTTTSTQGAPVIVNGQTQTAGNAATSTVSGQTVTTVTVDTAKIEKVLEAKGAGATVTIPVTNNSDVAIAGLTGQMVKNMETKEATVEVKTGAATYTLPASEINIDSVSKQLGQDVKLSDIKVQIKIAEPPAASVKVVENAAKTGDFTIMVPAVEFEISCTYSGKAVDVSSFNSYVERTVAIPDGVDTTKITTGVVVSPDGKVRQVPTQILQVNGKYVAKINSLTNSTYAVIWNPVTFADVEKHWAKDSVNNMGSRMIVTGVGNDNYNPNKEITRAEFAAIVVRALGLEAGTGENKFSDVNASNWFCGYVETASKYGIINGKSATTFAPNDKITREQAMAMISRAMKITGLEQALTDSEMSTILTSYTDAASSSSYAKSSIATCLKTGVVSGMSSNTLAPKNNITRAEVAVIVERLLKKSELI